MAGAGEDSISARAPSVLEPAFGCSSFFMIAVSLSTTGFVFFFFLLDLLGAGVASGVLVTGGAEVEGP